MVVLSCITNKVDAYLSAAHSGFGPGRGTADVLSNFNLAHAGWLPNHKYVMRL